MLNRSHLYKSIAALFLLVILSLPSKSQTVAAGGEIGYKFLRIQIVGDNAFNVYFVTVKVYKECVDPSSLPFSVGLDIYVNTSQAGYPKIGNSTLQKTDSYITSQYPNSCSSPNELICYQVGVYSGEVFILTIADDILIAYQGGDRKLDGFVNIDTHNGLKASPGVMGFTYTTSIAGKFTMDNGPYNASPVFNIEYPLILCTNDQFQYNFSATDPDGDSIAYSFAGAYQGYDYATGGVAGHPPFKLIRYKPGYSGISPFGSAVTIDPRTGIISGTAPATPGRYAVTVLVTEYRDKKVMSRHRKEMQFIFKNCTWPFAQLDSTYKNCNSLNIQFKNHSGGPIQTYFWDFGDPSTDADTSNSREPNYTYPGPGVYTAKLLVNKGTNLCKDSAFCTVIVDNGMIADFTIQRTPGICNVASYDFTSTSTQGSNPITKYYWDFGDRSTQTDVSLLQNPTYIYGSEGLKTIMLIVGNAVGCSDTTFKTIDIRKTLLRAPNDTTTCYLDTIRLNATTGHTGTYTWSPNYNISSLNVSNPLVSPATNTVYYVTFTDSTGCTTTDSVEILVRTTVNMSIPYSDTTICKGDQYEISSIHDGLNVTWQPVNAVTPISADGSAANIHPLNTMAIIATSHIGSCIDTDTINIKVVPPPIVTINEDTSVCYGAPVYLQATGGSRYEWKPAEFLSDPTIASPVSNPFHDIIYTVFVSDTLGCPKIITNSVKITTFRGLYAKAGADTMIVEGEPVQLTGSGGQYYQWLPSTYLSDANIANPIAKPFADMLYLLRVSDDRSCVDFDSVKIRTFKEPDIYVPNAFTPNGDGKNDLFYVFPVGFGLDYLKIFDRWGNLVFATANHTKGWDGTFNGQQLNSGAFVWIATGKNKKTNQPVVKKGTIMLIR
jgi:gliding motility-associated-like protein